MLVNTDAGDDASRFALVCGEVHGRAVLLCIGNPLLEVVGQVGDCVRANLATLVAQCLVINVSELRVGQRDRVIRRAGDRAARERSSHGAVSTFLEGRRGQLEGAGLMCWCSPAIRERRTADVFTHAHASASARTEARCSVRTGEPSRDMRPPSCRRQPGSAETSRSMRASTMSWILESAIATETSG